MLFEKLGYNVHFIDVKINKVGKKGFFENEFDGFKYYVKSQKYPQSKMEWFSYITSIKFVKEAIEVDLDFKPDIIIVYNYPAISLLKLTKYCKNNKIKLVADITEWYFPTGSLFFKIIKGLDSYFRMNYFHKKVDGLIVISKYLEDFYNGVNLIRLPPLVNKKSEKWNSIVSSKPDFRKLIYVGSISHGQKDRLDIIINSLNRIKERTEKFEFIIIGVTKSEYIKYFGLESLPESMDEFVSFLGRKTHKEVIKYIKESDYSIFLRSENLLNTAGFPTKFVESLACGTPVITNYSSDLDEYLQNGEIGFSLSISKEEELDEGLFNALNKTKEELLKMKNKSSDFNDFHYEVYVEELVSFLSKV
jgi:glycosyltransferase involved in cell wall biosynthesis